jgi:hypothetical protein
LYNLGVKSVQVIWGFKGHGRQLLRIDAVPRKYGNRSVFDTLVVHTVNHGYLILSYCSLRENTSPGKQSQGRVLKEIGGDLYKRWGMWFNSTIHVKSYQLQC